MEKNTAIIAVTQKACLVVELGEVVCAKDTAENVSFEKDLK